MENIIYFIKDGSEEESREVEPLLFDVTLNIFKWAGLDWVVHTYHGNGYKAKTLVLVGKQNE